MDSSYGQEDNESAIKDLTQKEEEMRIMEFNDKFLESAQAELKRQSDGGNIDRKALDFLLTKLYWIEAKVKDLEKN